MKRAPHPASQWTFVLIPTIRAEGEEGDDGLVAGMPVRLEAVVAKEGDGGRSRSVTLVLDLRTLPPVVTSLTAVVPRDVAEMTPEHGLTAEVVRGLPLSRLAKYAAVAGFAAFGTGPIRDHLWARLSADRSGFSRFDGEPEPAPYFIFSVVDDPAAQRTVADALAELVKQRDRESGRRRRNVISDELLDRVADTYRQAIDDRQPPKKAVQLAENVSSATAGRYIMRARARGYLGPTARGKKGEEIERR